MTYLHEGLEPKVIHRDLKSSSILLDKQWNPKVSDFGLAKLIGSDRSYTTTRVMGTFGYVYLSLCELTYQGSLLEAFVIVLPLGYVCSFGKGLFSFIILFFLFTNPLQKETIRNCFFCLRSYVAPEYASTGMLNERSDVYSFGVLMMEIISGRKPVDYNRPAEEVCAIATTKILLVGFKQLSKLSPYPFLIQRFHQFSGELSGLA